MSAGAPPPARRVDMSRRLILTAVCVLALATCVPGLAGEPPVEEGQVFSITSQRVDAPADTRPHSDERTELALPDGAEPLLKSRLERATPDGAGDAAEFGVISALRPAIRLSGGADGRADLLAAVRDVEGVAGAAALRVGSLPLAVGDGEDLTVAVVDLEDFRPLTPQVTADAVEVWQRLSEGDAAFTHDVGHRLKVDHEIDLGGRVPVRDGEDSLRIGAYASSGVPPVAEAVVSEATGAALGIEGDRVLLVALDDAVTPEAVLPVLEEATGLAAEVIPPPQERRAFLRGTDAEAEFEPFTYVSLGDGMIEIDEEWVERNIVRAEVPVFRGAVVCHRLMIPQLRGALQEIVDRELDHLIDLSDYGGCWVPRHILFDPNRTLSMHAWGLAIDFNVSTNGYGAEPQMDPRIVEVFDRWGFVWGGRWSTPDGMHFELGALLDAD